MIRVRTIHDCNASEDRKSVLENKVRMSKEKNLVLSDEISSVQWRQLHTSRNNFKLEKN